jgi:hypothetical protein
LTLSRPEKEYINTSSSLKLDLLTYFVNLRANLGLMISSNFVLNNKKHLFQNQDLLINQAMNKPTKPN